MDGGTSVSDIKLPCRTHPHWLEPTIYQSETSPERSSTPSEGIGLEARSMVSVAVKISSQNAERNVKVGHSHKSTGWLHITMCVFSLICIQTRHLISGCFSQAAARQIWAQLSESRLVGSKTCSHTKPLWNQFEMPDTDDLVVLNNLLYEVTSNHMLHKSIVSGYLLETRRCKIILYFLTKWVNIMEKLGKIYFIILCCLSSPVVTPWIYLVTSFARDATTKRVLVISASAVITIHSGFMAMFALQMGL